MGRPLWFDRQPGGWRKPTKYPACLVRGRWAALMRATWLLTLSAKILWIGQQEFLLPLTHTHVHTHMHTNTPPPAQSAEVLLASERWEHASKQNNLHLVGFLVLLCNLGRVARSWAMVFFNLDVNARLLYLVCSPCYIISELGFLDIFVCSLSWDSVMLPRLASNSSGNQG